MLRDPFTQEVAESWRWWSKGQLELFRPDAPKVLVDAITHYDAELTESENYETKQIAEEAKANAKVGRESGDE